MRRSRLNSKTGFQRPVRGRAEIAREREAAGRLPPETQAEVEAMILGVRPVKATT